MDNNDTQDTFSEKEESQITSEESQETEKNTLSLEELQKENADLKDKLMRALADTENMRRRMDKERADNIKYGVAPLAKALCPVADNLNRALQAIPDAMRQNDMCKNFILGVEMIDKQFHDAFAECHITLIDPKRGDAFSYDHHQAMSEIVASDIPPGTVAAVLQKGYILRDRLIRPAMVSVAKQGEGDNQETAHVDKSV